MRVDPEEYVELVLRCVERAELGRAYDLVSPERVPLRELIGRVARVVRRRCIVVPAPMFLMRPVAAVLERHVRREVLPISCVRIRRRGGRHGAWHCVERRVLTLASPSAPERRGPTLAECVRALGKHGG